MNPRGLVKRFIPRRLFRVVAPYGHLAEAIIYNCLYGFPARGMKVIGVTGTNGKTTTSFLIHRMLHESGRKAGLMTTVAWAVGGRVRPQKEHMTTVPIPLLMKRLKKMRKAGVEWLVLETTSHALVQYRTWGVRYSVAVLTNITRDHLDYHGTMQRYIAAKQLLFKRAERNTQGLQAGIINADDLSAAKFVNLTRNTISYGIERGTLRAVNVQLGVDGIEYDVVESDRAGWPSHAAGPDAAAAQGSVAYHVKSSLPGAFNVYNTLAAVCAGRAAGLTREQIERGIAGLSGVAGRMEPVDTGQRFAVIVDFAYTPDALENALTALRSSTKRRLTIVFGATGDRDAGKRGPMGEVVAKLADKIYLTDDETYTEDPLAIREAVLKGIVKAGGGDKVTVVPDRLEAIRQAFKDAKPGDTVLLAGIGHQDSRIMGGKVEKWDERAVARKLLTEL